MVTTVKVFDDRGHWKLVSPTMVVGQIVYGRHKWCRRVVPVLHGTLEEWPPAKVKV